MCCCCWFFDISQRAITTWTTTTTTTGRALRLFQTVHQCVNSALFAFFFVNCAVDSLRCCVVVMTLFVIQSNPSSQITFSQISCTNAMSACLLGCLVACLPAWLLLLALACPVHLISPHLISPHFAPSFSSSSSSRLTTHTPLNHRSTPSSYSYSSSSSSSSSSSLS